jgi:hypothetical protein
MLLHLRADDGIRTRDPHLGKVMRYQLRYIRTPRARSSPVAKHDDSPPEPGYTNPLDPGVQNRRYAPRESEKPCPLSESRRDAPASATSAAAAIIRHAMARQ